MSTLTVFKFSTPDGANQMLTRVGELQKAQLIKILDAAVVTGRRAKKPQRPNRRSTLRPSLPWMAPSGGCFSA